MNPPHWGNYIPPNRKYFTPYIVYLVQMAILDQVSMRTKTTMSTPNYPTTIGSKELFTLSQLHHVKNIWVHITFSNSFLYTYCHPTFFFLGSPCILTRRFPCGSDKGGQLLSCSIVALSFNHLPWSHPRSSAWGPDDASSPCPALVIIEFS